VASALAVQATDGLLDHDLDLAGSGLRDTIRLADSDAGLWASILEGNRGPVADTLDQLAAKLAALSTTLRGGSVTEVSTAVQDLLVTGRLSRRRLPTKAGQPVPDWSWVGIVVPDQAGELARLFTAVGEWGINVEDVRVEHSHEQRQGTAELAVDPALLELLLERLRDAGWRAYQLE
jgi:prephenate dehydrogenase